MKALMKLLMITAAMVTVALSVFPPALQAKDLVSYVHVRENGSLEMDGRTIWLYGIYIPPSDRTCRTFQTPIVCGPRAVLALDFKIGPFFVECEEKWERDDGSLVALCMVRDEDLSSWMLRQGWALALPDAPFEYQALEKIARSRGKGIWGRIVGP